MLAAMAGGQVDVLLMNREAYDIMSAGGYLLPLEDLLKRDSGLFQRVEGRLTENMVILEDNSIEHQLDENVAYQAETETAVNAILISSFELFEQAGFSGDVYLGVIGNSSRTEMVLRYIGYLTSEP